MRQAALTPEFIELLPENISEGVLYISMSYATTVHLCACGCRNKVVLPLSPAEWQLYFDGDTVSLSPSVGNWEFPCRSHYWIRNNRVIWSRTFSEKEIEAVFNREVKDLNDYYIARHGSQQNRPESAAKQGLLARLWHRITG